MRLKAKGDLNQQKIYRNTYGGGPLSTINQNAEVDLNTFNRAAMIIQKYIRGFIVRAKNKSLRLKYLNRVAQAEFKGIKLIER